MMPPIDGAAPHRLLIVDDAPPILAWARRVFTRAGWDVLTANDGAAAWEIWQQTLAAGAAPHLLLTDLNMPGLDGSALIALVRSVSPDAPIVVLTGIELDETVWSVQIPPRMRLMRKPVAGAELLAAATALVNGAVVPDASSADA